MAKRITWSRRAKHDLIVVRAFIRKDSERYAIQTIEGIVQRTMILLTFPQSGRIVPEFGVEKCAKLLRQLSDCLSNHHDRRARITAQPIYGT